MKLAHAAEGLGIDIEMHGPGPAARHCMTSIRNTNFYEMGLVHPKNKGTFSTIYTDYRDGLDAIDEKGCVYAPTGPGLGRHAGLGLDQRPQDRRSQVRLESTDRRPDGARWQPSDYHDKTISALREGADRLYASWLLIQVAN